MDDRDDAFVSPEASLGELWSGVAARAAAVAAANAAALGGGPGAASASATGGASCSSGLAFDDFMQVSDDRWSERRSAFGRASRARARGVWKKGRQGEEGASLLLPPPGRPTPPCVRSHGPSRLLFVHVGVPRSDAAARALTHVAAGGVVCRARARALGRVTAQLLGRIALRCIDDICDDDERAPARLASGAFPISSAPSPLLSLLPLSFVASLVLSV